MLFLNPKLIDDKEKELYYNIVTCQEIKVNLVITEIDNICKKYFGKNFKDIVLLNPEELEKYVKLFENHSQNERKKIKDEFEQIQTLKKVKSNYIVNRLYNNMPSKARNIIYSLANTKTCPYCNRNYIDIVRKTKDEYSSFFDLDHFYNKDEYPMFAVSLYNLIPTCPSCNRKKGIKSLNNYPYKRRNIEDDMCFTYKILRFPVTSENDIAVEIYYKNENEKNDVEKLYLNELYNHHKDIALEIIQKAVFHGEGYLRSLIKQFNNLFGNEEDIYRFIYGNYLNKQDWNKRPLAKFTYDLAKETLEAYGFYNVL